jgi:hypothetical protein
MCLFYTFSYGVRVRKMNAIVYPYVSVTKYLVNRLNLIVEVTRFRGVI